MLLASISSSFESQVASHGVYAVFALLALGAVLPAASEIVMLYAGAVAAGVAASHGVSVFGWHVGSGAGSYVVLALAGALGYVAGGLVGWAIGRYGGRPLLERHGRWLHVTPERLDRAEAWFRRWEGLAVFLGAITPVVRSFVAIPAGLFEMRLLEYVAYTLLGSLVWSFAFAGAGYGLGASYKRFEHDFRYVEIAIVAGVVLLAAYLVYRWVTGARVSRRAEDSAG
jgi:membrane protein DedA with SNARE-associated domain